MEIAFKKDGEVYTKNIKFQFDFGTIKILKNELGYDYFVNAAKKWEKQEKEIEAAKREGRDPDLSGELDLDELTYIIVACTKRGKNSSSEETDELTAEEVDSLTMQQLFMIRVEIEGLMAEFQPEAKKDKKPPKNAKRQN